MYIVCVCTYWYHLMFQDSDGLANDLCSALQSALGELRFSRAEATDKPHPHVEVQITPAMELDEDHVDGECV